MLIYKTAQPPDYCNALRLFCGDGVLRTPFNPSLFDHIKFDGQLAVSVILNNF